MSSEIISALEDRINARIVSCRFERGLLREVELYSERFGWGVDKGGLKDLLADRDGAFINKVKFTEDNPIFIGEIREWKEALPQSRVISLDLYNTGVDDEGAEILAEILPRSQVVELNLGHNLITMKGVKTLAAALPQTSVIHLDLTSNPIRSSVSAIARLLSPDQLKKLKLDR
jgi:hypothetical protein